MSFLSPKPATSSSENTNNSLLTSTYAPTMQAGNGATNFLAQLLGVSPGGVASTAGAIGTAANGVAEAGGAQAGYNDYLKNAGYENAFRQLSQGITGQGAASGLLNSGSTQKRLIREGTNLNSGMFNNYLQQLTSLSGQGLQAGGLVANAGQRSTSTGGSPSTVGSIASTVGGIASIFSDRRLKRDIELISRESDGLGLYAFRYLGQAARVFGVMADEVAKLRPWALGRKIAGYQTVDYGAL